MGSARHGRARTDSIFASTSGVRVTSEAAAFSFTCSGVVAPMMAEETSGRRSTHASASWARVTPTALAMGASLLRTVALRVVRLLRKQGKLDHVACDGVLDALRAQATQQLR